jgi:hypothetical protein
MRRSLIPTAILVLVAVLLFSRGKDEPRMGESKPIRTLTSEQLLNKVRRRFEPVRVRTATDVLPGGYAAAMAPVVVDWEASRTDGPGGFAIVHNLNHGGNPVDGTTVLCSARIPLDGVEAAEFTLLPLDRIGREGLVQHGQLRLIFAAETPVEILHVGDATMGSDAGLNDLVFSWEAWRPPDEGYDVITGMDPSAYLLSPRLFSGPQRFLDDALGGREWISYRLRLPAGREGFAELLRTCLALADGVARHAISRILEQGEEAWLQHAPSLPGQADREQAEWEKLRRAVAPSPIADVPLVNLAEKDQAYQTLLRSCATMALYSINVTADRLAAAGHTDGLVTENLMRPDLGEQEPWMSELAGTDLRGVFLRAPAAVRYLREHPTAFPKKIPAYLERAGFLQLADGKPVKFKYSLDKTTPYGTYRDNQVK